MKEYGTLLAHFQSYSDKTPNCPGCYSQAVSITGDIHIDGNPQSLYVCDNCSRAFSKSSGTINSLLQEVKTQNEGSRISYTAATESVLNTGNINTVSSGKLAIETYQLESKVNETNNYLQTLVDEIRNLRWSIDNIVQKNSELMEKLAVDPLVSIRKLVNEFNLK